MYTPFHLQLLIIYNNYTYIYKFSIFFHSYNTSKTATVKNRNFLFYEKMAYNTKTVARSGMVAQKRPGGEMGGERCCVVTKLARWRRWRKAAKGLAVLAKCSRAWRHIEGSCKIYPTI